MVRFIETLCALLSAYAIRMYIYIYIRTVLRVTYTVYKHTYV